MPRTTAAEPPATETDRPQMTRPVHTLLAEQHALSAEQDRREAAKLLTTPESLRFHPDTLHCRHQLSAALQAAASARDHLVTSLRGHPTGPE